MNDRLQCRSPVDGRIYAERPLTPPAGFAAALEAARRAQPSWQRTAIVERQALLSRAVDAFVARGAEIAAEISWQMGRPISQAPGEIRGFEERARHMIAIAADALADLEPDPREGFRRFLRREPLGVVLVVAPWNYPYLTAVNAVVPALMAGNAVVLKPSAQTPLAGERFAEAFAAAGLPDGLFQCLHLSHETTLGALAAPGVDQVCFTGSGEGGRAGEGAAAGRFIGVGLELGGKDPAYVRADADLEHAVAGTVDGAMFNSGQSCCGIERVYVHTDRYDDFVEAAVELVRGYRLDSPLDPDTTLGPMVRAASADFVRAQCAEAVAAGARPLLDPAGFPADAPGSAYLAPQLLVDVDHSMRVMREETFGPVAGIMRVRDDEEALRLMNDSDFGLTASVWTRDQEAALALGERVATGTFFMNRCDYLDPALAWTGVKDSGRGCTLSPLGYGHLTRPKSFHLRLAAR